MKKIFTLFAACVLGIGSVNAATVVSKVYTYNNTTEKYEVSFNPIEGELTKNSDGNLELSNFINSGDPLIFTFDSSIALDAYTALELKGYLDTSDKNPYIMNASGNYITGKLFADGSDLPTTVYYPYVETDPDYTYIMRVDPDKYGADYYAWICFSGFDKSNGPLDWYYYEFFFNMPADATPGIPGGPGVPGDPVEDDATSIKVTVDSDGAYYYPDYEDYSVRETKDLKSFDAELVIAEDGTYTLKNIFNTTYSISYKVGEFTDQIAPITYTGNISVDEGYEQYPYFMNGNKYMTVNMQVDDADGTIYKVNYLSGDQNVKYTNVYKSTDEEVAQGYYEYYVYLCLDGYIGEKGFIDSYWVFGYDMPKGDTPGAEVEDINADENEPVEFYNLQGVKVANPSNGIFIRRQGKEVKKVVVR